MTAAAHVRWLGTRPLPRSRRAPARAARAHVRRLPAAARAPARLHARPQRRPRRTCWCRRHRSAPSSCAADRGGDVTYHGPGQLVGYPIVTLPEWRAGIGDVVAYVRAPGGGRSSAPSPTSASTRTGSRATPACGSGDEKVAAIGVKVARGRTRHGFALNVDPDLSMFDHIVPCGITDRGVTSVARLLGDAGHDARRRRRRRPPGSPTPSGTPPVDRQDAGLAQHRPRRPYRCARPRRPAAPSPSGCSGASPRPG